MVVQYDVIVVGAGIIGSSTAYQLVKNGYKTLLLEQFSLGHSRGSSGGHSRITRYSYSQQYYADMMPESYAIWEQLEKDIKQQLLIKCGLLTIAHNSLNNISTIQKCLKKSNCPIDTIRGSKIQERFQSIKFDDDNSGLFESSGGVLKADQCLKGFQREFVRLGGTLNDQESVLEIRPGQIAYVKTTKNLYACKSLVITAGPWTNKLVNPLRLQLPLQPERIKVLYWKQKQDIHGPEQFPTLILFLKNGSEVDEIYALPALEYPDHVKMCLHTGQVINPDERDICLDDSDEKKVENTIRNHFPSLQDKASIKEVCIYTVTPDRDFILDCHPKHDNIIIGAGFSGHGFKLAPVVGKLLGELATKRKTSYDVSPFRMNRFNNKAKL